MIEKSEVVSTDRELAAVVRLEIPRDEMKSAFAPAIHEILDALNAQGKAPVGPAFAFHFRLDPEVWDFQIGFPTETEVEPVGRVQVGELPAARVIRTVYRGPYEGLGEAWGAFQARIEKEGVETDEAFWERYVGGPESTSNPQEYRTQLNRVLRRGG